MHEYELLIETMNPCGGEAHATKEFLEVETESPMAYVKEKGRYPVISEGKKPAGSGTAGPGTGIPPPAGPEKPWQWR